MRRLVRQGVFRLLCAAAGRVNETWVALSADFINGADCGLINNMSGCS